jgi:cytochrome bd ubiquinol oxidase subunit II
MTTIEPSALALFWAAVIAGAIVVYVILDGFDLGVGILFGTTRDAALRKGMMDAISPFWDGNETWLVVIGASLFAAFPVVYAVFLPAFYIPVLLLLFGLIFRGVAFEFRYRGSAHGLWDWGFFLGSTIAAFVQGAAVGAMVRGIPVVDGQYAGGRFEWLAPLPVFTGIGLVLGYALLGASWLVLKSEGALREWAWPRVPRLAAAVLVVLALAAIASLAERDRVSPLAARPRPRASRPQLCRSRSPEARIGLRPRTRTKATHDGFVLPGVVRNARCVVLAVHDSLF